MKILFIILALAELVASALFLVNQASDIQLGFGLVFLFMGLWTLFSMIPVK